MPPDPPRSSAGPSSIGSVLPLPLADVGPGESLWTLWTSRHAQVSAFRTARGALRALLETENVRRLWLPAYICSVTLAGAPEGCEVCFYGDGPGLELGGLDPAPGEAVLAVDYFGRPACEAVADMARARPDVLWIEDRAQALDPGGPAWGEVLLFSPRKLVGVGDGGLLVSDRPLPSPPMAPPADPALLWAAHVARLDDPEGAHPERWSPAFQAREAAFTAAPAPVSALTRVLLERIAAGPLIQSRRANYARLAEQLPEHALWPEPAIGFAPLAFPVRVEDAAEVARRLAAEGLFCARHWPDLPSPAGRFPDAARLSRELLSLPCDQRYGEVEMDRLAEAVRRLAFPAR